MYKTFDNVLGTVVEELWFCRMEGCNAAGVTNPGGIKQHVRDHHSDSLDTYDFNLDVSPTVREIQDRPYARVLADRAVEARRVASLSPGVVEIQSVYYCPSKHNGCTYRYPLRVSQLENANRVRGELNKHFPQKCKYKDKSLKAEDAVVGSIQLKATSVELYVCKHPGCDFTAEATAPFNTHLHLHGYGLPLLRTKRTVEKTSVIRMEEGDWEFEGSVKRPEERRWVELLAEEPVDETTNEGTPSCADCGTQDKTIGSLGPKGRRTLCNLCSRSWWRREQKRLAALGVNVNAREYTTDQEALSQYTGEEEGTPSCADCGTQDKTTGSLGPKGKRTLCNLCSRSWWRREQARLAALGVNVDAREGTQETRRH